MAQPLPTAPSRPAPPSPEAVPGCASADSPVLREYLGRVRSHLPVRVAPDILRELKTSILDRADAIALAEDRDADEAVIARALAEVGEPETVAACYVPRRNVVEPESYRAFVVVVMIALGAHLALLTVATTLGRTLQAGPFSLAPVAPGWMSFAGAFLHALFVDIGVATAAFWALPRTRRMSRIVPTSLRVDASPRSAVGRAVMTLLVGVILAFFRDDVFVLVGEGRAYPLFSPWFATVLPLVLGVLGLAIVTEILYLVAGETRLSLAADALHGAATVAVMVHLARGEPLLQVPAAAEFDALREPVDGLLDHLGTSFAVLFAGVAALKTIRRSVRLAQV